MPLSVVVSIVGSRTGKLLGSSICCFCDDKREVTVFISIAIKIFKRISNLPLHLIDLYPCPNILLEEFGVIAKIMIVLQQFISYN